MQDDIIENYIRVGTDYYRKSNRPSAYKDKKGENFMEESLTKWSKGEIETDFGKGYLDKVTKYVGFCNEPNHIDFRQEVHEYYNQYFELEHKIEAGTWEFTEMYLRHIFGEQYELGLDYLALLYLQPTERLPILCLVSQEQTTGKSTFVFWLKDIFGTNATLNSNEDFESRFNSDWAGKLLIGVEETLVEKNIIYERIKSLSTSGHYKSESKGRDKKEVEFFGKFVLCSNHETTFVPMHVEETRFWVRRINSIRKTEKGEITNLRELMKKEIPYFLFFLKNRGVKTPNSGRLWFAPEMYDTEALQAAKQANRPKVEKEILEIVGERMEIQNLKSICFTSADLYKIIKECGLKGDKPYIDRILKENLKKTNKNSSYKLYTDEEGISFNKKGRYYEFTYKEVFGKSHPDESKETKIVTLKNEDSVNELFMSENERLKANTKRFSEDL